MGSFASSDTVVLVAWAVGIASLVLSAALSLEVLRIRRRTARRARRQEELIAGWRPMLFEAALGGTLEVPDVEARDEVTFLALWNEVQEALQGEPREPLNRVAEAVGVAAAARRCLGNGHPVARVQALQTVGYLGRAEDYPLVRTFLDDPRAYLSLTAARALIRIDPVRAPADVLPRMAARSDWPASLLVRALGSASPAALARQLRAACARAPPERLTRLLALVELVDERTGEDVLRGALVGTPDPEMAAAVLKHARTPGLVDLARAGCGHAAWAVRTQAAAALGRIGTPADRDFLLALLRDPQWWVRYRAAQALVSGRLGSPVGLPALVEGLGDRYARDILSHVLAEERA